MKNQKIKLALKIAASAAIILAVVIFLLAALWHNFTKLDYFRIKDVLTSENNDIDLSYLKGQYIFSVNLSKESAYLSQLYPVYRKIRLVRVLPSRIYADFIKRKAVAYVKLYRYFFVDEESVLFDSPGREMTEDLPVITGLETKIFGPKSGKRFNVKELALALTVIKDIRDNRMLRFQRVKKIDVAHPANASVILQLRLKSPGLFTQAVYSEPLEVKIGQVDVGDKINMLANLFIQLKKDWFNIKYIDLRFKEPVIKFKDKDVKK